ncbi:hypothetical protein L6164_008172 [Bauhinia variegata]|uniref:Uncharacterized protein n=1 Tax=Bauhinia variegata TaxID=167791 RepID=A0ACB9PIR7_BAUVA|nr:hypothetical protein L6164_008172 [Bauhinia variegata]
MAVKIHAPVCEAAEHAVAASPSVLLYEKCGSEASNPCCRICDSRSLAHLGNNRDIQGECHVLLGTGNEDAGLPSLEGNQARLLIYLLGAWAEMALGII